MRSLALTVVLVAGLAPAFGSEPLTQADLLRRVIDLDRLMTPPAGERTAMFSSYDRRSRLDDRGEYVDWDANGDAGQFIREEEGGWQVMAEMGGPGAITRIWSANPHGALRVILDGETVIDAPFEDLFNKKLPPFDEPLCYVTPGGGHNCYFPIGYSRSCKVVARNCRSYYQINYVTFPAGVPVESFRLELDEATRAVLAEVGHALVYGLSDKQLFGDRHVPPVSDFKELHKGQKLEVETYDGGGVIRALYVALTDRRLPPEPYALHRCILRVFVDREKDPRVEAPLIDFFGSGFDVSFFNSLPLGTDKWTNMPGASVNEGRFMYCYFPMPFRDVARIEIENLGNEKVGLMMYARVDRTPPPEDCLRFHARFRKEDPCQVLDYPILAATGAGRIVGCTLDVDCPRQAWWGEGDDKVWIDGERFPSYFGTGSEDYLGDAWGLHPHTNALQGGTRVGAYGKNSAYRWHINDCIDFERSVRFTIENWQHGRAHDTYYGTVAYWYGDAPPTDFFKRLTLSDVTPPGLRIPGSVEIEGHIVGEGWGNVLKEKYADGVELSGQQAANITTSAPVRIHVVADRDRTVKLKLRTHPRRTFDSIAVADASGRTVGTVRYNRDAKGIYDVGVLRLHPGENPVTVQCSPKATLDCWILEDVPKSGRGPEGEDLALLSADGLKVTTEYAALDWSGGGERVVDFTQVGQIVKFALPELKEEAIRHLRLVITRGPTGGRFQTLLDDRPIGEPFTTSGGERKIDRIDIAPVQLAQGQHTLAFRAEPDGARATGQRLELDTVELMKAYSLYALECEQLTIVGSANTEHVEQGIGGCGGDAHVWCRAKEPGAWIEFEVPVRTAGRYALSIVYTTSFDYGLVQTYVNGQKAGEPVDTFGPLQAGPVRPLGTFDLPAGPLRIKAEVVGKNPESPGYYFGCDCIIVAPGGRS